MNGIFVVFLLTSTVGFINGKLKVLLLYFCKLNSFIYVLEQEIKSTPTPPSQNSK